MLSNVKKGRRNNLLNFIVNKVGPSNDIIEVFEDDFLRDYYILFGNLDWKIRNLDKIDSYLYNFLYFLTNTLYLDNLEIIFMILNNLDSVEKRDNFADLITILHKKKLMQIYEFGTFSSHEFENLDLSLWFSELKINEQKTAIELIDKLSFDFDEEEALNSQHIRTMFQPREWLSYIVKKKLKNIDIEISNPQLHIDDLTNLSAKLTNRLQEYRANNLTEIPKTPFKQGVLLRQIVNQIIKEYDNPRQINLRYMVYYLMKTIDSSRQ
jgi:hypothetical protein